jgi:hypothetical protein
MHDDAFGISYYCTLFRVGECLYYSVRSNHKLLTNLNSKLTTNIVAHNYYSVDFISSLCASINWNTAVLQSMNKALEFFMSSGNPHIKIGTENKPKYGTTVEGRVERLTASLPQRLDS